MIAQVLIGDDGVVEFRDGAGDKIKLTEAQKQTALLAQIWAAQQGALTSIMGRRYDEEKLDS